MRYRDIIEGTQTSTHEKTAAANTQLRQAMSDRADAQRDYAARINGLNRSTDTPPAAKAKAADTLQKRQKTAAESEKSARTKLARLSR